MLVLTRKPLEAVIVAEPENLTRRLKVTVLEVFNGKVRLGFEVDPNIVVHRAEVWEKAMAGWLANPTSTDALNAVNQSASLSNTGMTIGHPEERPLFKATGPDGTAWLFVILPDNGWAITCNGKRVVDGGVERSSINSGVRKFMLYTTVPTLASVDLIEMPPEEEISVAQ
jgi:carbon storage regulator CsrA